MRSLLVLALAGCSSNYGFSPVAPTSDAPVTVTAPGTPVAAAKPATVRHWSPVEPRIGDGAAAQVQVDSFAKVRMETFDVGGDAKTPVSDFLFVVDNSASMVNVLGKMQKGFTALAQSNAFPSKSRIAVMSTMPAALDDLTKLHPAVATSPGLLLDPGFLRLVDKAGLDAYRQHTDPTIAARYKTDACDSAWFSPTDANEAGVPCLVADTQIARTEVRVEAGLTAFSQLVQKNHGHPTFRQGAAVNVIIVSDTNDPGVNAASKAGRPDPFWAKVQDLIKNRPSFSDLNDLVQQDNTVASFRVHAIAPATECSEAWNAIGPSYAKVVQDGGGVLTDLCTTTDYTDFIQKVADQGARPQRLTFPLGEAARQVESVKVDGRATSYALSTDGKVLFVDGDVPSKHSTVEVQYKY